MAGVVRQDVENAVCAARYVRQQERMHQVIPQPQTTSQPQRRRGWPWLQSRTNDGNGRNQHIQGDQQHGQEQREETGRHGHADGREEVREQRRWRSEDGRFEARGGTVNQFNQNGGGRSLERDSHQR